MVQERKPDFAERSAAWIKRSDSVYNPFIKNHGSENWLYIG